MLHNSGLTSVIIRPITAYINNVVVCSSFGWREVLRYRGRGAKAAGGSFSQKLAVFCITQIELWC